MLKEFYSAFSGLPPSTQWAIIGAFCFFLFLIRDKLAYWVPAIAKFIFTKKGWKEVKKEKPESKTEVVIKYLNRAFVRSKIVYDVSQSFVYKNPDEIKDELMGILESHRGRGEMVVLIFAYVEFLPDKILVSLKFVFDKAIEQNNLVLLIIFPKCPKGNMEELYKYIIERNRMENKSSVSVKMDCREDISRRQMRNE